MKKETVSDASLRAFLLGKIDDEQRERIEGLFLTDSQERERVVSAEEDLIEDYLENVLTPEDKQRFIALYAQTPEQQQQLRIIKSIKNWAIREPALPKTDGASGWMWTRLPARSWLKPVFLIPISVAAMFAIVVGVVWLNSRERNRWHLAIEKELVQLNTPDSLRESLPGMMSVDLSRGAVRGAERETAFKRPTEFRPVQLHLLWVQEERYPSYQAEIKLVGSDESFTIADLKGADDQGYAVRLRLPAALLERGQHQIRLSGINSDGTSGLVEEYFFTIND
jgi:hypothetical protein